jgi:S-adenosylmethionine:tRNA ribosyltransferase-isomerase
MKTSDYDYPLPPELIALKPPSRRGQARLLSLDRRSGAFADLRYPDFIDYLKPGDVVVLNDTKVMPARLITYKTSNQAKRELVLLEKHGERDNWHNHKVLFRGSLQEGEQLQGPADAIIRVEQILDGGIALVSSRSDLLALAKAHGSVPLPPYMHRAATNNDRIRYQTIWAKKVGSVAAPTASLNMTRANLQTLRDRGITVVYATLHVGLGTFLPIREDDLSAHVMHHEYFHVPKATVAAIQTAKTSGHRVVAIGTTITRTLEYAASDILHATPKDLSGEANNFIYPGYEFKVIDALLTNFHAPGSTVLMLTAAFAGWDHLKTAYAHAIDQKYRLLSYGDSMFIH